MGRAVVAAEAGGIFVAAGSVEAEQAVAGDGVAGANHEDSSARISARILRYMLNLGRTNSSL